MAKWAYGIVNGRGATFNDAQNELGREVVRFLDEGWTLQGSIIFIGVLRGPDGHDLFVFSQAIAKQETSE